MIKNVCVYCSSSNLLDDLYYEEARKLGRLLAENNYHLVYGGGNVGLMGILARSVHAHQGRVIGVIPRALKDREGIAYDIADELIVTESLRERKGIMYQRADAFIALPGGLGTLEELVEVLTLKQLGYHNFPIVIVSTHGYYEPLEHLLDHFAKQRFLRPSYKSLYRLVTSVDEVVTALNG